MIKNILIDLDGTLLPMDQDYFLEGYFKMITKKFSDFNPKELLLALSIGIETMIKNDGSKTNKERFWEEFSKFLKLDEETIKRFEDMYKNEFQDLIEYTNPTLKAKELMEIFKEKGLKVYCCTNPLFPQIATFSRIRWANLNPDDFIHVTTYENSHYAKPNIKYYEEVLENFNLVPEECIMIGNDVSEDLIVKKLNIKTFLLKDNLINSKNLEIITDYEGNFDDLLDFARKLS